MKLDQAKLVVRTMTEDDRAAIVEIDRAVSHRDRSVYIEAKFFRAIARKGQLLTSLVAAYEGKVVGFIMGEIYLGEFGIPEDTATIDTLAVHPDQQRNGIAQLLFEEYKKHAQAAGVARLHTLVDWSDRQLIHFFDKAGFSPARTLSLEMELID